MDIKTRKEANVSVLTISGRLDAVTTPEYENKVKKLIDDGDTSIVIDFDGLSYISSAGLRGLLVTAKQLKAKNGQVCFANVKGAAKEVFNISGFNSIFKMHDSVDAALATMS